MDESKGLKVGVIGAGANTKLKHIPGLQAIEGVSVEVVCNRSVESSRAAADEFGISRVADRWEDVVADPALDAICIGTWPYLHAPISIASLEAGKHVLTEARMAMNSAEAEAMLAASSKRSDLVAQIVPSPFTLAWDKTISGSIEDGAIGDLREVHFSKALPMNFDSEAPMNWRQDKTLSGNNTLMLGIYYEPILRWFSERPERVLARGSIYTKTRENTEKRERVTIEIPETLSLIAEYRSGLTLTGRMTGVELGSARDEYVINGSKGTLQLDLVTGKLSLSRIGAEEAEVPVDPAMRGDWRVEADFVDSIREGKAVELTSFSTGLDYMRFTDAVIASIEADSAWIAV